VLWGQHGGTWRIAQRRGILVSRAQAGLSGGSFEPGNLMFWFSVYAQFR